MKKQDALTPTEKRVWHRRSREQNRRHQAAYLARHDLVCLFGTRAARTALKNYAALHECTMQVALSRMIGL